MEISFPDIPPAVKQPPGTFSCSEQQRGISEFNLDYLSKLWELLHVKLSPEGIPDLLIVPLKTPFCKQAQLAPLLFCLSRLATISVMTGECSIYKMNYFADVSKSIPNAKLLSISVLLVALLLCLVLKLSAADRENNFWITFGRPAGTLCR